jgi:hypothetical protein
MTKLLKLMTLICVLGISAFANDSMSGTYIGKGTWKDTKGAKGTWTREMVTSVAKAGKIDIKDHLVVLSDGQEIMDEKSEWSVVEQEQHGFYNIVAEGKTTGTGYCVKNNCHLQGASQGGQYEETFIFNPKTIKIIGSDSKGTEIAAWQGIMRKK